MDGSGDLRAIKWLIIPVAIVLILVLVYYLTLTTRPSIAMIMPEPNARLDPGEVEIAAVVDSQRPVESAVILVDGQEVPVTVVRDTEQRWTIGHTAVLPRGEREISLTVRDETGRVVAHTWRVHAGGPLVPPRAFLVGPPPDGTIRSGFITIRVNATTFGPLGDMVMTVDGVRLDPVVENLEISSSEYASDEEALVFEWEILANAILRTGDHQLVLTISDEYGAESSFQWIFETTDVLAAIDTLYFPETSQYVAEPFLSFWRQLDGNRLFGPPVGPPVVLENGQTVQYFRFARFEEQPDGSVSLGLLGREVFGDPEPPLEQRAHLDSRFIEATGHEIHGPIRRFWENNGEVPIFGFPISREFELENGSAQYFERVLLEYVPDEFSGSQRVRIAPLGEQLWIEHSNSDVLILQQAPAS